MTARTHTRRAAAALAHLPEVDPALAALALWCRHHDDPHRTFTCASSISYGPEFSTYSLPEQIGTVAHHVLHVALHHSARQDQMAKRLGPSFDADLFNLAADALINELLIEAGHAVPRPALRGKDLLHGSLSAQTDQSDILATWDAESLYFALTAEGASGPAAQSARSYAQSKAFAADVETSADPAQHQTAEEWRARILGAAAQGAATGAGIGPLLARFADLPRAQVPWEQTLRGLMTKAVMPEPRLSYSRPARRWIGREALARDTYAPAPVFEPGQIRGTFRPHIVAAVDTSSSVTDAQLDLFASEALSLARRTGAQVHLIGFDEAVFSSQKLDRAALRALPLRRGGGTDYAPVMDAAQSLDASAVIVFTDLDAPLGRRPLVPVIWATPIPTAPPAWGTHIDLSR